MAGARIANLERSFERLGGELGGPFDVRDTGVPLAALRALQDVDLVAPPELLDDSGVGPFSGRADPTRLELGPLPQPPRPLPKARAALARLVEQHRTRAAAPTSAGGEKEARMVALIDQIHALTIEITARKRGRL